MSTMRVGFSIGRAYLDFHVRPLDNEKISALK